MQPSVVCPLHPLRIPAHRQRPERRGEGACGRRESRTMGHWAPAVYGERRAQGAMSLTRTRDHATIRIGLAARRA
jgi:hypothetical protein